MTESNLSPSREAADWKPGTPVKWYAVVSNYGHIDSVPAIVLSCGAKRVRIETRYCDGNPERRVNVKPENLKARAVLARSQEPQNG